MSNIEKVLKMQRALRAVESGEETTLQDRILTNTASQEDIAEYAKQLGDAARASVLATGGERAAKQYAEIDAKKAAEEVRKSRAMDELIFSKRVEKDVTWLATGADISMRARVNRAALAEVDSRKAVAQYLTDPKALEAAREFQRQKNMGLITPEQVEREIAKAVNLEHINLSLEGGKFRARGDANGMITVYPGGLGDGE